MLVTGQEPLRDRVTLLSTSTRLLRSKATTAISSSRHSPDGGSATATWITDGSVVAR